MQLVSLARPAFHAAGQSRGYEYAWQTARGYRSSLLRQPG